MGQRAGWPFAGARHSFLRLRGGDISRKERTGGARPTAQLAATGKTACFGQAGKTGPPIQGAASVKRAPGPSFRRAKMTTHPPRRARTAFTLGLLALALGAGRAPAQYGAVLSGT